MLAGFGVTAVYMLLTPGTAGGAVLVDPLTAGLLGVPVAFIAAIATSLALAKPDELTAEIASELRISGGETLHARLTRLSGRGKAPRP